MVVNEGSTFALNENGWGEQGMRTFHNKRTNIHRGGGGREGEGVHGNVRMWCLLCIRTPLLQRISQEPAGVIALTKSSIENANLIFEFSQKGGRN